MEVGHPGAQVELTPKAAALSWDGQGDRYDQMSTDGFGVYAGVIRPGGFLVRNGVLVPVTTTGEPRDEQALDSPNHRSPRMG
jgi:hypothetical protein